MMLIYRAIQGVLIAAASVAVLCGLVLGPGFLPAQAHHLEAIAAHLEAGEITVADIHELAPDGNLSCLDYVRLQTRASSHDQRLRMAEAWKRINAVEDRELDELQRQLDEMRAKRAGQRQNGDD